MYHILYYVVRVIWVLLLLMLVIVPVLYGIKKREFIRVFLFTWALWAAGWLVFGFFITTFSVIISRMENKSPDTIALLPLTGIFLGWIPGIVMGFLGAIGRYKNPIDLERKNEADI